MSSNTIFVLIIHHRKLLDFIDKIMFTNCDAKMKCSKYLMRHMCMGLEKYPIIRYANPRSK
jgi:hypothetical protein